MKLSFATEKGIASLLLHPHREPAGARVHRGSAVSTSGQLGRAVCWRSSLGVQARWELYSLMHSLGVLPLGVFPWQHLLCLGQEAAMLLKATKSQLVNINSFLRHT